MGKKKEQKYYFSDDWSEDELDHFLGHEAESLFPNDAEPQPTILSINKPNWKFGCIDNDNNGSIEECYIWNEQHFHETKLYKWITEDPFFLKRDSEIMDDQFYKLITEDPFYLAARFSQEKIQRWREELFNKDKNISTKAKDRLEKIGSELAKRGKLPSYDPGRIAVFRAYALKKLKDKKINNIQNDAPKRIRLKELFGDDLIKNLPSYTLPSVNGKLADLLTATKFNMAIETVKTYIKGYSEIKYGGIATVVKSKTCKIPLKK